MIKDPNEFIFTRDSLDAAMTTNCTYYHGMSARERFGVETDVLIRALEAELTGARRVLDYGLGVGRMTRAILEHHPHIKVLGVDNSESMLRHARGYIPDEHFEEGRLELLPAERLHEIETGSIDLILTVYVLQHVDGESLPGLIGQFRRLLRGGGKLYVLNAKTRAVPRKEQLDRYKRFRKWLGIFERYSGRKQIQRLLTKLDNKSIYHDDGLDVSAELEKRFEMLREAPLDGHPHIRRLMKNHFSRFYGISGDSSVEERDSRPGAG